MQRTVIVEGPDGAGKSTLIEFLGKWLGRNPQHTGGPGTSAEELEERMRKVERCPGGLFDRCPHISNRIYAANGGRDQFFPEEGMRARLFAINPILVYCRLTSIDRMLKGVSKLQKLHKSDEHRAIVEANYRSIVEDYDRMMNSYEGLLPIIRYDYEQDHPAQVLGIIRELQTTEERN